MKVKDLKEILNKLDENLIIVCDCPEYGLDEANVNQFFTAKSILPNDSQDRYEWYWEKCLRKYGDAFIIQS